MGKVSGLRRIENLSRPPKAILETPSHNPMKRTYQVEEREVDGHRVVPDKYTCHPGDTFALAAGDKGEHGDQEQKSGGDHLSSV